MYWITENLNVAMSQYIGEQTIKPRKLSNAISKDLYNSIYRPLHLYYYGYPDTRLRQLFSYEQLD